MSVFPEKRVPKVYGPTLLALREGGSCEISRKKALVERPRIAYSHGISSVNIDVHR